MRVGIPAGNSGIVADAAVDDRRRRPFECRRQRSDRFFQPGQSGGIENGAVRRRRLPPLAVADRGLEPFDRRPRAEREPISGRAQMFDRIEQGAPPILEDADHPIGDLQHRG